MRDAPITRALTADDAAAFQVLRLRALRESPESFGSTYEEEADRPLDVVAKRLAGEPDAGFVVGGWLAESGPLMGIAGCYRDLRLKWRHTGVVWGMFVASEARRRGLGQAVLDRLLIEARRWPDVTQLTLTVVPEHTTARALYLSRGFTSVGVSPRHLRDATRDYDLEHLWRLL
jgi:GNAT superfamily N-acetyltransferase